jgi:hypothetical protein
MRRGHFGDAEAAWVRALTQLEESSPSDVRVRATLSHLVRLASIYQRRERPGEADRVMTFVSDYIVARVSIASDAGAPAPEPLRYEDYSAQYHAQRNQTLDAIYGPRADDPDRRRDFEPTVAALIKRIAR